MQRPQVVKLLTQFFGNLNSLFVSCIALEGRAGQRERERRRLRRRRESSRRRNTERPLAGKTCSLQLVGFRGRVVLDPF